MVDETSKFPEEIDTRHYFSDMNLSQMRGMEVYQILFSRGDYAACVELLTTGKHNEIEYNMPTTFTADILNMLENRLYNIEDYAINTLKKTNIGVYSPIEPVVPEGEEIYFWVS